jgi:hypothetical protein
LKQASENRWNNESGFAEFDLIDLIIVREILRKKIGFAEVEMRFLQ